MADDIVGKISGMFSGGLNSDFLSGIVKGTSLSGLFYWLKIILSVGGLVFVTLMLYKFFIQYKISVTIKSSFGRDGTETRHDRAKLFRDTQGKLKLVLFKLRFGGQPISCPLPPNQFKSKQGSRDHYDLWLDDNGQVHPIENPSVDTSNPANSAMKVRPQERDAWARLESKIIIDKYKQMDFLEKYKSEILVLMSLIVIFLMFFFGVRELGTSMSALAQQFGQVASSCISRPA